MNLMINGEYDGFSFYSNETKELKFTGQNNTVLIYQKQADGNFYYTRFEQNIIERHFVGRHLFFGIDDKDKYSIEKTMQEVLDVIGKLDKCKSYDLIIKNATQKKLNELVEALTTVSEHVVKSDTNNVIKLKPISYYQKNKDKINSYSKSYYQKNKEKMINYGKEYHAKHKEEISLRKRRRYAATGKR